MQTWQRALFTYIGLAVLMVHFTALCVYTRPGGHSGTKPDYIAGAWVYPWFHQSWSLFAPTPSCNYSVYVVTAGNTEARDVFDELVGLHQTNRLAGYGPVLIALSNTIHYFEKNSPLQKAVNGPVKHDRYFDMLRASVIHYLDHKGEKTDGLQIILLIKDQVTGQSRVYFDAPH